MGWIHDSSEAKTLNDYVHLLNEICAYRELDGQDFDFGLGVINNEMSLGSEDAYYRMDIQILENIIEYWHYEAEEPIQRKKKVRPHKRHFKKKEKNRIDFLNEVSWMNVVDRGDWKQRCYRGKRSAYLKKESNRMIRRYKDDLQKKGNTHRKVFDFWWKLY